MAVTINGSSGITANDGSVFTNAQGNVGIGTSSPTAKLDVVGNIAASGTVTLSGGTANGVAYLNSSNVLTTGSALTFNGSKLNNSSGAAAGIIQSTDTAGSGNFVRILGDATFGSLINFSTGSSLRFATSADNFGSFSERMRLDAAGNLGIGTTSPGARLDVNGSNGIVVRDTSLTASQVNIGVSLLTAGRPFVGTNTDSNPLEVGTRTTADLIFVTNSTERMRIDTAGRFMVGKTNTNELQAGGSGYFYVPGSQGFTSIVQTVNTNNFMCYHNKVGTSGGFHIFLLNDSTVGSITTNGSSTAYNTSSDYRLKNITGPVTNSGAYIDSLNPVEGTWKADGSAFVGLIAHEVQEVSRTQIATGEKDGAEMQAMDYSAAEIIANLIAEVKSLRRRLAAAGL